MTRRRAVDADHTIDTQGPLPLLYNSLAPVVPERHAGLRLKDMADYSVTAGVNAIPVTCDEFAQVLQHYPIVIASGDNPVPVALVGLTAGQNDFVDDQGQWAEGHYIPAYLRRYPFLLVREGGESTRNVLCADLSSMRFSETEGQALFEEGKPSELLNGMLDFCDRYEMAMQRTRQVMELAAQHDLLQPATVTIERAGKSARVEGFLMIAEEKMRELDDATLADFARRGILSIFAGHQFSMTKFAGMGVL